MMQPACGGWARAVCGEAARPFTFSALSNAKPVPTFSESALARWVAGPKSKAGGSWMKAAADRLRFSRPASWQSREIQDRMRKQKTEADTRSGNCGTL